MKTRYVLPGALFHPGDQVCYDHTTYVVIARRLTTIGIVYQLLSDGIDRLSHHNVPQAMLVRVRAVKPRGQ